MSAAQTTAPGRIVLFGSGETSPSGQKVFNELFRQLGVHPRCALLETAAGFELNSYQVIERVGEFLQKRLQNYQPQVEIVRARMRGTPESPDNPQVVKRLLKAEMIFMGPGSPTYAVRQLKDSLAWQVTQKRHAQGAALVFASAGVIAIGRYALPVYEIFKAGEDLHWNDGLDFFGRYGLELVLVPHWNNREGGAELDTSRCFMGRERFEKLAGMLPPGQTILGIDENTALMMDLQGRTGQVLGAGEVTWVHVGHLHEEEAGTLAQEMGLAGVVEQSGGHVHRYRAGERFPLDECCPLSEAAPEAGWLPEDWAQAAAVEEPPLDDAPSDAALQLMAERQAARNMKDWRRADALREELRQLGWAVEDGKEGARLRRAG